jgi:hypothetical protein
MGEKHRRISVALWLAVPATIVIALLPWLRNHDYLRDFYDYGLVISALGRIGQGQLPYVDFATPIQAGFFGLSWLVESAGGGTYLALSRGGAVMIVLMAALFTTMLARQWPWWAAAVTALAVTVASASQHTILWHNTLGVFTLGLVAWATAVAPVIRREAQIWHALAAAGLFLGGINKVNFQLAALAAALAWALRAGLTGLAGWGRVLATALTWLVVGVVLPVGAELAWTGASPGLWWHNVVELAAASRVAPLDQVWSWDFLSTPIHNYYGPLLLPQVGAAGLVLSVAALAGCWMSRTAGGGAKVDAVLLPVAVVLSGVAGAVFLATNQEIAYVGLAAWLVLVVSVWLGFATVPRRGALILGVLLPAAVIGTAAWQSAWQGQRSQFGYSPAARVSYQTMDQAGTTFAYLHGVHLPPENVATLGLLERWLPGPEGTGFRPVFYGTGMEWVDRFMPGVPAQPTQPLWVHWDTTYGPQELWRLIRTLATDLRYRVLLTTLARNHWTPEAAPTLERFFAKDLLGPVTERWTRTNHTTDRVEDAIQFNNQAGGNVAGTVLVTENEAALVSLPFEGDRIMLGIMGGEGRLRVAEPTYRFGADAVVERSSHAGPGTLQADFRVTVHGANPEVLLWSGRLEMAPGVARVAVPFKVDAMRRNLLLQISVPGDQTGQLMAGYRNFQISHAVESAGGPPKLRPSDRTDTQLTPALTESLFTGVAWRPEKLVVRGGGPGAQGLELAPGGEVWMHSPEMSGEIRGQLTFDGAAGGSPMVRVVWYKGGRLQMMQQGQIPAGGAFDFHVWCAEPGGWFGILVDQTAGTAPTRVRVNAAKFSQ